METKMVMRRGMWHDWNYSNINHVNRGDNFQIYQVKRRNRASPYGTGMPTGSKLHWKINAREKIRRLGNGLYQVKWQGIKRQAGFTLNKYQKYIRPKWRK